jgi:hypothetical protein
MIITKNDELIAAVSDLRALFPEWRLGQLVANLALAAGKDGAIWDVQDEELLAAARRLIERSRGRREPSQ